MFRCVSKAPAIPGGAANYFGQFMGADTAAGALSHYKAGARDRDIVDDACINCEVAGYARRVAGRFNQSRVYMYVYDFPHDVALHGSDIAATFGSNSVTGSKTDTPEAAVELVQHAWTQFAKTGVPELPGQGSPKWPRVGGAESTPQAVVLGEQVKIVAAEAAACAAWVPALRRIGGANASKMCAGLQLLDMRDMMKNASGVDRRA